MLDTFLSRTLSTTLPSEIDAELELRVRWRR